MSLRWILDYTHSSVLYIDIYLSFSINCFIWAISSCWALIISSASCLAWGSMILACELVRMADEWWGIIAFIYCTSPSHRWFLRASNVITNTTTLAAMICLLRSGLGYMACRIVIIRIAIAATINTAI